mgnify:CR=1 FL=1
MMNKLPPDYHVHTQMSPDSKATLKDICACAVDKGIEELAVTDHFEFFPQESGKHVDWSRPRRAEQQILVRREETENDIVIRYGVEVGQPQLYPGLTDRLLLENPYDFVIGSLHCLGSKDLSELEYSADAVSSIVECYLDNLLEMVETCPIDALAHFDLPARYAAKAGVPLDILQMHPQKCEKILRLLIRRGIGLEINTSGLRQPLRKTMPGENLLCLYRDLGGKWVTLGSDAHRACDVACGFPDAIQLLRRVGINRVARFNKRKIDRQRRLLGANSNRT